MITKDDYNFYNHDNKRWYLIPLIDNGGQDPVIEDIHTLTNCKIVLGMRMMIVTMRLFDDDQDNEDDKGVMITMTIMTQTSSTLHLVQSQCQ